MLLAEVWIPHDESGKEINVGQKRRNDDQPGETSPLASQRASAKAVDCSSNGAVQHG